MIHIPQDELLKKIEYEHKQLFDTEYEDHQNTLISSCSTSTRRNSSPARAENMSILPTTCASLRDRNNNSVSDDEDEMQTVLITGEFRVSAALI